MERRVLRGPAAIGRVAGGFDAAHWRRSQSCGGARVSELHEEIRAGTLAELADYYAETPVRGEITVVLEGTGVPPAEPDRTEDAAEQATSLLAEGLTRREVVRRLTESMGIPRNEAYRLVMELP